MIVEVERWVGLVVACIGRIDRLEYFVDSPRKSIRTDPRSAGVDYLVRSMFILAHVYKHAPVTSHDIQGIFSGVCLRTVQRILKTLVGLGYLNGIKGEGVSTQITYEVNEQYVPWVAEYVKTLPLNPWIIVQMNMMFIL